MKKNKAPQLKRKIIWENGHAICALINENGKIIKIIERAPNNPSNNQNNNNDITEECTSSSNSPNRNAKEKRTKTTKIVAFTLIFAFFVCIMPFWFGRAEVYIPQQQTAESTFLKLWHIDSFEGGSGNRANFLNRIAVKYHAKVSCCFVIVQTLTEEEAVNAINNGNLPDLISFSHHISESFCDKLIKLSLKSQARPEIQKFAQKDGANYAIPWYMSGYCLIGNSAVDERVLTQLSADTAYSFSNTKSNKLAYTAGLKNSYAQVALSENTTARANLNLCDPNMCEKTSFQAYSDFVKNNYSVLLGTARDFYRVQNRVGLGAMQTCAYVPLQKFSDLIQYIGILNESNQAQAENFISFLCETSNQRELANIGLFSPNNLSIYTDAEYKKFEKAINNISKSINIFSTAQEKETLYKKAINSMC